VLFHLFVTTKKNYIFLLWKMMKQKGRKSWHKKPFIMWFWLKIIFLSFLLSGFIFSTFFIHFFIFLLNFLQSFYFIVFFRRKARHFCARKFFLPRPTNIFTWEKWKRKAFRKLQFFVGIRLNGIIQSGF
jgi:hypothetical protein